MRARALSVPVFLACLTSASNGALVPLHVTGAMAGNADIADHPSGATDSESFDAPLRVDDLSASTTQRTRTASVDGQTAQAWSQCDSGTTTTGGLRASVMSLASQTGETRAGCDRSAQASTSQATEFRVTGRAQAYRFRGAISGANEPGVAGDRQKRAARVRLVSDSGVVHEFAPAEGATSATFEVAGTLEPGTYRVEVTTHARAESGKTRSTDPMIASVHWTLEPSSSLASRK